MLINTDLSTDATAANLLAKRSDGGTTASASSAPQTSSGTNQIDPSLQRLTDLPASVQDADWTLDLLGADQTTEALRQGMLGQPGTAMSAQANQLSQNVLSLLQPADEVG